MHQSEQEGKGVLCIDRSFVGSFNKVVAKTHEGFCLLSQTKNNVVVRIWCASRFALRYFYDTTMEKKNMRLMMVSGGVSVTIFASRVISNNYPRKSCGVGPTNNII